jgi:hypothetical protein
MTCHATTTPGGNRQCPQGRGLVAPSYCARNCPGIALAEPTPEQVQAARVDRADRELASERHNADWQAASAWATVNAPDMLAKATAANCGCNRVARRQAVIVAWQMETKEK